MKTMQWMLTVVLAASVMIGCDNEQPAPQTPDVGSAAKQATGSADKTAGSADKTASTATADAAAYVKKMTGVLDNNSSQIDALKQTAKKLSDAKLNDMISSLDAKLTAAKAKLAEIKNAEPGTTGALQDQLQKLISDLTAKYAKAQAQAKLKEATGGLKLPGT